MSSPGDGSRRDGHGGGRDADGGDDDRDLDAAIDALARQVERAIAVHRRELAAVELEPLSLSPLDHVRSVLSPRGGETESSPPGNADAESSPTDGDADPSANRDDNP